MNTESSPAGTTPLPRSRVVFILLQFTLVRIGLRLFGFRRLLVFLGRNRPTTATGGPESALPAGDRRAAAVAAAEQLRRVNDEYALRRADCLEESFVLWWRLHRQGIAADFRLGVRTITGRLQSHAWVEYDGDPLNDEAAVGSIYTPFDLDGIFPTGAER